MILFFDTETTGLADFNKRASDPSQPHLVQLAMLVSTDDGREIECQKYLVRPHDWEIPAEAAAVHNITNEFARLYGRPEHFVASALFDTIRAAKLIVAHNLQFDKFIARIAARRYGCLKDEMDEWWKALPTFCTMREMTDICQIPGMYGKFKWPRLTEAYEHAFGKKFEGAHDALADVRACKEVYFWLQKRMAI